MASLSPSASSSLSSSDDMASSLNGGGGGPRTSPTNSLNSDTSAASGSAAEMKLHCTICQETFRSPKVLHCLHSFCAACLESVVVAGSGIGSGGDHGRIVCAECHMVTKLAAGGVGDLLPDYGMIRLLNANGACARTAMLCTACKGSEKFAQAQCLDCVNLLCSNCVVAHQLMHCFNRHRVYPLNDARREFAFGDVFGVPAAVAPCPQHPAERLELFCRTCDIPVCKECLDCGGHPKSSGHDVATIQEVSQREIAGLMQIKEYAQAKSEEFTSASQEPHRARMATGYHTAQTAIEDTFQFYTQVLKERRDELLQSLDGLYEDKQTAVNMMQDRIIDTNRRLTNVCHFMDRLLTYGSDAEILLFKRQLNILTDNIISSQAENSIGWTGDIQFVTNYTAIQSSVQNSYGFIHKKTDMAAVPQSSKQQQQQQQQQQNGLTRLSAINNGSHRTIPSLAALGMGDIGNNGNNNGQVAAFPFPSSNGGSHQVPGGFDRALPSSGKARTSPVYCLPFSAGTDMWMDGSSPSSNADSFFNISTDTLVGDDGPQSGKPGSGSSSSFPATLNPARPTIRRSKMAYVAKFGDFGTGDGQFSEPSGVAVNANRDILVADTNNHRVQIFDHEGRFKFAFGECGKRDGQMLYPNRVAVARNGDVVVTERSPTHQIQVYNQYGVFVRKFGADILQHPRGVTVDHRGRVIVVECKVMRVVIFEPNGRIYSKFSCSQHLEFPNGVAANDNDEIFISDNRAHCVKVFNYHGIFLRQIGGEGMTNFPIGVCITERGHVVVADNHNNFNLTIFAQDGSLISAYESRVKHAQCFDLTLMDEGSVVLASKDYKVYVYRFASFGNNYPVVNDGLLHSSNSSNALGSMRTGGGGGGSAPDFMRMNASPLKNLIKCDYQ